MTVMDVDVGTFACRRCGFAAPIPKTVGWSYGPILVYTPDCQHVRIVGIDDKSVEVVAQLLDEIKKELSLTPSDALLFEMAYGASCDSVAGQAVQAFRPRSCPRCRAGYDDAYTAFPTPPVIRRMEIPEVSHTHWDQLGRSERKELLLRRLQEVGVL